MYLELTFNLNEPITENGEIVAALLNDLNYETVQDEGLIKAYKPGEEYSLKGIKAELTSLLDLGLCAPNTFRKLLRKVIGIKYGKVILTLLKLMASVILEPIFMNLSMMD